MPDYRWLPNTDATRLHAVEVDACPAHPGEACGPPACGDVDLTNVPLSGNQPPRCKRCVAVVEATPVRRPMHTTATYEITVHAYGLTADQLHALFIRVADAAHALDEEVSVSGGPPRGED